MSADYSQLSKQGHDQLSRLMQSQEPRHEVKLWFKSWDKKQTVIAMTFYTLTNSEAISVASDLIERHGSINLVDCTYKIKL